MKKCYFIINKKEKSFLFVGKLNKSFKIWPQIESIMWPIYHHMSKTKCETPYEDEEFIIYRGLIQK